MRKRIEKLARGIFESESPVLAFQVDKIELEVLEGQDAVGEFVFSSMNDVCMRGVIYSDNPRMECLTPQFEGKRVRIRYHFHGEGLLEGDTTKGDFYIAMNQGEYNLSYVVNVTKMYADSSIGKIKNLSDFTKLAKENFKEACKVFASKAFVNVLKHAKQHDILLYEGLSMPPCYPLNVEEFLVGTGKKNTVLFSVEKKYREYFELKESWKDSVSIKKDDWGYLEIEVKSDEAFLVPEKNRITSEDFFGSVCPFSYFIDETKLHAGKNYARLSFTNVHQSEEILFCVSREKKEKGESKLHKLHEYQMQLIQLYLAYRLKRIVTGEWARESEKLLKKMQELQPDNSWYPLFLAQVLFMNKQRQDAVWLLEEYKRKREGATPAFGYYLYLMTLLEREPSYVKKQTENIEKIYEEYPDDFVLYWVLLFLKPEYLENDVLKLKSIKQKIENGCYSPLLYLEAYYLYQKNPYLLTTLGDVELKVLHWAAKEHAFNKNIAMQIMELASTKRVFDKRVFELLREAYRYDDSVEMLSVICSYLIKGQCFAPCYLEWYARAVREELRITNLNEAYMMSLDQRSIVNLPRTVQMYFQYDSRIPDSQKAVLFVNMIAAKEENKGLYENYRKMMEQFALEQMKLGRMDDNLSVIYEEVLKDGIFTKELAVSLAKILFTHKISCFSSDIVAALIVEPQLERKVRVNFHDKSAYFPLYSNEYAIVLEDRQGRRYTTLSCQIEKLMRVGHYLRKCIQYAPGQPSYALGFVAGKENFYSFGETESALFEGILNSEQVSQKYKAKLLPRILEYYVIHDMEEQLLHYLKEVDFTYLSKETRAYVFELFITKKMYEKAYLFAQSYGVEQIDPDSLFLLCTEQIKRSEDEEDDFLIGISMKMFMEGKYDRSLLHYLCLYYKGPTKEMYLLWEKAKEYEINTVELEESILVQMLYTTEFIEQADEVYTSYKMHGTDQEILAAYLNYFSQCYFVEDAVVGEKLFPELEEKYLKDEPLSDAGKLALLKFYANHKELQEEKEEQIDALLLEYTGREMYFDFYKQFGKHLQSKYFLYDKVFVTYKTKEKGQVILHYSLGETEEDFHKEEMEQVYDGIYVKQFVLFFGESLSYYIEGNGKNGKCITESGKITRTDIYGEENENRYDLLNDMLMTLTLEDYEELEKKEAFYEAMDHFVNEKFEPFISK